MIKNTETDIVKLVIPKENVKINGLEGISEDLEIEINVKKKNRHFIYPLGPGPPIPAKLVYPIGPGLPALVPDEPMIGY